MRPFFGGFAGSYWWYGPRIRREMGQTTPETRRAFYALQAPSPDFSPAVYCGRRCTAPSRAFSSPGAQRTQSTPPRPEMRKPSCAQRLDALVTKPGEKSGLDVGATIRRSFPSAPTLSHLTPPSSHLFYSSQLICGSVMSRRNKQTPSDSALSTKEFLPVPSDENHINIIHKEECRDCHTEKGEHPLSKEHPPKDQCLKCHERDIKSEK